MVAWPVRRDRVRATLNHVQFQRIVRGLGPLARKHAAAVNRPSSFQLRQQTVEPLVPCLHGLAIPKLALQLIRQWIAPEPGAHVQPLAAPDNRILSSQLQLRTAEPRAQHHRAIAIHRLAILTAPETGEVAPATAAAALNTSMPPQRSQVTESLVRFHREVVMNRPAPQPNRRWS